MKQFEQNTSAGCSETPHSADRSENEEVVKSLMRKARRSQRQSQQSLTREKPTRYHGYRVLAHLLRYDSIAKLVASPSFALESLYLPTHSLPM